MLITFINVGTILDPRFKLILKLNAQNFVLDMDSLFLDVNLRFKFDTEEFVRMRIWHQNHKIVIVNVLALSFSLDHY